MNLILVDDELRFTSWRLRDGRDVLDGDLRTLIEMLAEDAVDL